MDENEVKNEEVVQNAEVIETEVVNDSDVKVEENINSEQKGSEEQENINTQTITISDDVIAQMANTAASSVKGVSSLKSNAIDGIFNSKSKGVKIQRNEKGIIINLSIVVEMGYRIPDVSFEIQNIVKTQVESFTGLNVLEVNIFVAGMNTPDKENENKVEE